MSTIQEIEAAIAQLPPEQFAQLKQWVNTLDPEAFDAKIERDLRSGKLDHLADEALREDKRGDSRPL